MTPSRLQPLLLVRSSDLLALIAILGVVLLGRLPASTLLWEKLGDFAHFPAFILITALLLRREMQRVNSPIDWQTALRIAGIALAFGVGIELVQKLIGRDASVHDVGTDFLGILATLGGYLAWQGQRSGNSRARTGGALLSVVSILVAAFPVADTLAAYQARQAQFPVIARFNSARDLHFISPQQASLELRAWPRGNSQDKSEATALWALFVSGPWPGVIFHEPEPDWSGYRTLVIDLANPDDVSFEGLVRIHDHAHNEQFDDRFTREFTIPPMSELRLALPLEAIAATPSGRRLDLTGIDGIMISSEQDLAGRRLVIEEIRLER